MATLKLFVILFYVAIFISISMWAILDYISTNKTPRIWGGGRLSYCEAESKITNLEQLNCGGIFWKTKRIPCQNCVPASLSNLPNQNNLPVWNHPFKICNCTCTTSLPQIYLLIFICVSVIGFIIFLLNRMYYLEYPVS